MATQKTIIATIDKCISSTSSTRKKKVGLPKLKKDILKIPSQNMKQMILLLESAVLEPAPTGWKPRDDASKYWVNRHSQSMFRITSKKTSTRKVLEKIIVQYYKINVMEAPKPRKPVILGNNTPITPALIKRMKEASRRADHEIVLLGHGETTLQKKFKIPSGTTIKFYTPDQAFLRDVDVRAIAGPEIWGRNKRPQVQEMAGPGTDIMDHRIGELDAIGGGTGPEQVGGTWMDIKAKPRFLSSILKPNMGVVHFAACRAHPSDDMIAFNKGAGINEAGPEDRQLSEKATDRLAKEGGRPKYSDYMRK
ncbi:MAG: hypothetical protein GY756_00830 [bacterium]|nr:hypothetical protein [bacterium]